MAIYVDDFLIFYKDDKSLKTLKQKLQDKFLMKDLGPAKGSLGIRIGLREGTVALDQQTYIAENLEKFKMADCKPVGTPSNTSLILSTKDMARDVTGKFPYQEAVGSLLYIAQCTRPDISFAVNDVSRFNKQHSETHWIAVKRIMRYLKGTMDLKLTFADIKSDELKIFCDADWGSDPDERRSCSGFVTKLADGAISWSSKRQTHCGAVEHGSRINIAFVRRERSGLAKATTG
jgi:Reverse transcriptase (RNA-dependent DNA polymerase)